MLGILWLAVLLGLPQFLASLTGSWPAFLAGGVAMLTAALLVVLGQAPADYLGRRAELEYGQAAEESRYVWRRAYVFGVVGWVASLTFAGMVAGGVIGALPRSWPVVLPLVLTALATLRLALPLGPGPRVTPGLARRPWTEQLVAELKRRGLKLPVLEYFDHGERSLAGGWAGFGPLKRLWVSSTLWDVPPKTAAALLARELTHDARGHRLLSLLATATWMLAGCVIGHLLLPGGYAAAGGQAAAVFFLAVWLTTWNWLSLLFVFPAMGRWQVLAADRGMLEAGFTLEESLTALSALHRHNRPDDVLPAWVTFVFHPIPPMTFRREALIRAAGLTENREKISIKAR